MQTRTTGPYYLGRVKRSASRGDTYHFATVEPLVESDPTGAEWIAPLRDTTSRFPRRGLVHWHEAPFSVPVGSLWQFTIDEHPSAERGDRAEHYQLQDPQEPIEVLDLRNWNDENSLRGAITADGIPLSPAPLARRVLFWLASGDCVGPLLLKLGPEPGLWVLDAPEAHRDASRMPVFSLSSAVINPVAIDGRRHFVSPRLELGPSVGIQNWMSDAQVARSVLSRLRRMDPQLVKALGVTDHLFREYLAHVDDGMMGRADPVVERARADRLRGVREAILRDVELLREAAEALLATDPLRMEVKSQMAAELRARQTEIDATLAGATEQLERLQERLDAKSIQNADLDAALLDKRRELEARVASFDQEVTAKLKEIARRPEAIFADAAVMRAILASAAPIRERKGVAPAPTRAAYVVTTQLGDSAEVRRALAAHAGTCGLSVHAMVGLHAAFVTGAVPVVAGTHAYDLLRSYASAVAGGRLHWIPIGSSTMEPLDLLGRFDNLSGRILPSPSGLLDVAEDAMQSGRLHIVVLEGFNRAPTEAYLSPILDAAEAGRTGDAARTIPIASSCLLAEDDPYREMARLVWPSSVLIACLPSDGSVTLPVPPSIWRFLALLDADDRDRPPLEVAPVAAPACSEIAPTLWKESVSLGRRQSTDDYEDMLVLAQALSLPSRDVGEAARMRGVLRLNGLPDADATGVAAVAIMISRSGAGPNALQNRVLAAGVALPGWRTVLVEAQRLRS